MTGARLFVYPSHYEGFGMPVLEAMACGTPVVTSTADALLELCAGAAQPRVRGCVSGQVPQVRRHVRTSPVSDSFSCRRGNGLPA